MLLCLHNVLLLSRSSIPQKADFLGVPEQYIEANKNATVSLDIEENGDKFSIKTTRGTQSWIDEFEIGKPAMITGPGQKKLEVGSVIFILPYILCCVGKRLSYVEQVVFDSYLLCGCRYSHPSLFAGDTFSKIP